METKTVTRIDEAPTNNAALANSTAGTWQRKLMRCVGRVVLAVCPRGRGPCENTHCAFRPLCSCALEDLTRARIREGRVWVMLALSSGAVLVVAFIYAVVR